MSLKDLAIWRKDPDENMSLPLWPLEFFKKPPHGQADFSNKWPVTLHGKSFFKILTRFSNREVAFSRLLFL